MYTDYFGLKEAPFSIAPNPSYLYMSERHREALAHLLYGFRYDGGFVLLTGEVGTGKTTVCRCLLEQVPEDTDVALIFNPCVTVGELLASICDEFGVNRPQTESIKVLVDCLNTFLLECNRKGRKAVLVLDEAQNLSCEVLEQIRLLTNLETNTRKLLQIVMLGQPELLNKLALPEMRQLAQRITARYHLGPLAKDELPRYIRHRLAVAGTREEVFSPRAVTLLYRLSGGIPRVINVICDRALLGAYSENTKKVSPAILERAAREVLADRRARSSRRIAEQDAGARNVRLAVLLAIVLILLLAVVGWRFFLTGNLQLSFLPPLAHKAALQSPSIKAQAEVAEEKTSEMEHSSPVPVTEETLNGIAISDSPRKGGENSVLSVVQLSKPWPQVVPAGGDERQAFAVLFGKWNIISGPGDESPCLYAQKVGLLCMERKGSLEDLFDCNRPAVLPLVAANGAGFFATLLSLDRQQARLVAGESEWSASYEDVNSHWSGRFRLLWRPPPGYKYDLWADAKGEEADWLKMQLAAIQGLEIKDPRMIGEERFAGMIKKFQASAGILPDGIVGFQTIVQLNSYLDPDIPRLHGLLDERSATRLQQ